VLEINQEQQQVQEKDQDLDNKMGKDQEERGERADFRMTCP